MRPPVLDPVLAVHLLACPPCRDARPVLVGAPLLRDAAPPPRVWEGILVEVHRHRRVERHRQVRRHTTLRRPHR
ncbi:hypothetical protein RHODO2019_15960 [Rhodococcus antarcticus]|uniref:Zinc finger protein n=1 Tax=Rhodococcus antarcticus TaxID=2987751 RepID=A0ABY6NYY4_9NOCA|nr:hypothetical protein [Rhodococcus antarcticus]UZJ24599.1 hypothetical protein RHODO2019_15960 [Rhodococcus antarcticus]